MLKFDLDMLQVRKDLEVFGAKLAQYQAASKKVGADVLRKKGGDLVTALSSPGKPGELRKLMPAKGSIRSSNIARMASGGGGIKVSDGVKRSVYSRRGVVYDLAKGRYMATASKGKAYKKGAREIPNIQQELVKRELNRRERGRGYLAYGSSFRRVKRIMDMENQVILNRVGVRIADAFLKEDRNASVLTLWDTVSKPLLRGLVSPDGRSAVRNAFKIVIADMDVYLERKQREALEKAKLA